MIRNIWAWWLETVVGVVPPPPTAGFRSTFAMTSRTAHLLPAGSPSSDHVTAIVASAVPRFKRTTATAPSCIRRANPCVVISAVVDVALGFWNKSCGAAPKASWLTATISAFVKTAKQSLCRCISEAGFADSTSCDARVAHVANMAVYSPVVMPLSPFRGFSP